MSSFVKSALFACLASFMLSACQKRITPNTGIIKITFRNMVGPTPMSLDGPAFTNPFGETYTISKFKYYISNLHLGLGGASGIVTEKNSYHLVDQSLPETLSFGIEAEENTFTSLSFLVGVDSARNVSGAQTGALDPLNDMFWTWSSGYIMAKMEGNSPQSNQAFNKIEYHLGGFSGPTSVLKEISLAFPAGKTVIIKQGQTTEIIVEADFNKWWQSPNDITIASLPVCTMPGVLAKNVADNYSKMFTVTDVVN